MSNKVLRIAAKRGVGAQHLGSGGAGSLPASGVLIGSTGTLQ